jgi:hypothetical protein
MVLPSSLLRLTGFHCASEAFTLTHQEDESRLLDQDFLWQLVGSSPSSLGDAPGNKGGDKSLYPQSRQMSPQKCCGNLNLRYRTLRQFSKKQHFIVLTQTQQTGVQRLSPENKSVPPNRPLQAGYRNKKQSSTLMCLSVTSLAISFFQCYVTFMFQFFKVSLSALPSFLPSHHQYTCFFFGPCPCYSMTFSIFLFPVCVSQT